MSTPTGEQPPSKFFNQRRVSTAEVTAVIVLVIQLGALIWGAATLSAAVTSLSTTATDMKSDIKQVQTDVNTLKVDVSVLKSQGQRR